MLKSICISNYILYYLIIFRDIVMYRLFHLPMDGSDEFLVPSADIDRAWLGDRLYESLYLSCWFASMDLDLNLDLLNLVRMAPKKSRFFFLLRPRSAVGEKNTHFLYDLLWVTSKQHRLNPKIRVDAGTMQISNYQRRELASIDQIFKSVDIKIVLVDETVIMQLLRKFKSSYTH